MKLEITKEKVLEAANKCSQAKETLKTLFPEVFEDDKYLDLSEVKSKIQLNNGSILIERRMNHEFKDKGFYLNLQYNWEIKTDSTNLLVLIPTKK